MASASSTAAVTSADAHGCAVTASVQRSQKPRRGVVRVDPARRRRVRIDRTSRPNMIAIRPRA
jgi:recombinational DNA repair ATPase RecF